MEISVEELNELLDKARKDAFKRYNQFYTTSDYYIPESCGNCPNHPSNGGSGNCQCILGQRVIY